jgi:uncharacterized membrane protein YphA (DoxX/SURF4 family)
MYNDITIDTPAADTSTRISAPSKLRRSVPVIARSGMGLLFLVCGLNGFLNFIPPPSAPMPENAAAFAMGLMKAGYFMPLLAGVQTLVGALLLLGRFVPLALIVIAPVVVNILMFHAALAPEGLGLAIVLTVIELYLAYTYRDAYRPLFQARAPLARPRLRGERGAESVSLPRS